jgi:transposase InsO family protein
MAWRIGKVDEKRKEFIEQVNSGGRTITDLCKEYEISRKTAYKWIDRYETDGEEGLKDRSRSPHSQPGKTDDKLTQKILAIKNKYPSWGPKKILAVLEANHPEDKWPSDTTIGNILEKHGLVIPRKYRKRFPSKSDPLSHCQAANDIWSVDFKGWFLTKDGIKCDPLTITDAHTRFILTCIKLESAKEANVWKVLEEQFYKNGLPKHIRHDNGPPFATSGAGRLSTLSIKIIKTGVIPEWIEPGKPYQNGRHERMHKTLKAEGTFPRQLTIDEQQMKFRDFINYYNYERPHEALGQRPPGSVYVASDRHWDGKLHSPEYDEGCLIKRVSERGQIFWKGRDLFIGKTLRGEYIAIKENDQGEWNVYFGPVFLGLLNHENNFITPMKCSRINRNYKVRCY